MGYVSEHYWKPSVTAMERPGDCVLLSLREQRAIPLDLHLEQDAVLSLLAALLPRLATPNLHETAKWVHDELLRRGRNPDDVMRDLSGAHHQDPDTGHWVPSETAGAVH